jgi:hypothetical protein
MESRFTFSGNMKPTIIILLLASCLPIIGLGRSNGDTLAPQHQHNTVFDLGAISWTYGTERNRLLFAQKEINDDPGAFDAELDGQTISRSSFVRLLRSFKLKKQLYPGKSARRFYAGMANAAVKLRLYPFAMQSFYQTLLPLGDSSYDPVTDSNALPMVLPDTLELTDKWVRASLAVDPATIINAFSDGKPARACAILLHVKQPVFGEQKAFTRINNVGHMFITLIKYNTDSTNVSRSFGFYPSKESWISATPLAPTSTAVIKDDAGHDWDEVAGKFISVRQLQKILLLLQKFQQKKYHLNKNNCTDFGLYAASISGISIPNTSSSWVVGSGNNPGSTGQRMMEGRVSNADAGDSTGIFRSIKEPAKSKTARQ